MGVFDLDTIHDLQRLAENCPEKNMHLCQRTLQFIRQNEICAANGSG
jgi:hypothetical protein